MFNQNGGYSLADIAAATGNGVMNTLHFVETAGGFSSSCSPLAAVGAMVGVMVEPVVSRMDYSAAKSLMVSI